MRTAAALAALALAVSAAAQQGPRVRKPPERISTTATNRDAGDGNEVDIPTLAADNGNYDHKRVRTRGVLETLGDPRIGATPHDPENFLLRSRHSNHSLLLIPGYGLIHNDLRQLAGNEVLAEGVVRILRVVGESVADPISPELPPLPMQAASLPRVSITALSLSSAGKPAREEMGGLGFTKQVLANPGAFAGKTVSILGRFRGRNLHGDLPEASRRKKDDWVLLDGELPLWVTDRPPKGRGFTLDADYRGDTERWLEVEGKPEVVEGVLYLRASKVSLAPRRTPSQP
jgi:hypothetical protein